MCPTKAKLHVYGDKPAGIHGKSLEMAEDYDWKEEARNGGSLRQVDLQTGVNGWSSPPGDLFIVRGKHFFSKKQKSSSGDWLLKPVGVDWLRSAGKLDNVLGRPDNRIMAALRKAQSIGKSLKSFIFAVNLQVPGREHHSAVFYYATEEQIPAGSLFYRFVHEDDAFRNSRFKIVNRIVKGPWIVRATVGNYAACLLGRALTCHYVRATNYLEIDVDIGSSTLASAILHLALGYVTCVTIDMGFLVEAQAEEELPERLLGAVRLSQMEMSSATLVDLPAGISKSGKVGCRSLNKVKHHAHLPVSKSGNEEKQGSGEKEDERS